MRAVFYTCDQCGRQLNTETVAAGFLEVGHVRLAHAGDDGNGKPRHHFCHAQCLCNWLNHDANKHSL